MATFIIRSIDTELVSRDVAPIYDFQHRGDVSVIDAQLSILVQWELRHLPEGILLLEVRILSGFSWVLKEK